MTMIWSTGAILFASKKDQGSSETTADVRMSGVNDDHEEKSHRGVREVVALSVTLHMIWSSCRTHILHSRKDKDGYRYTNTVWGKSFIALYLLASSVTAERSRSLCDSKLVRFTFVSNWSVKGEVNPAEAGLLAKDEWSSNREAQRVPSTARRVEIDLDKHRVHTCSHDMHDKTYQLASPVQSFLFIPTTEDSRGHNQVRFPVLYHS